MASTQPGYALFRDSEGWAVDKCPNPYGQWTKPSADPDTISRDNKGSHSKVHRYALQALLEYARGDNSDIGVVRITSKCYASQWKQADGSSIVAYASYNASTMSGWLSAGIRDERSKEVKALPGLATKDTHFNDSSILILYMLIRADMCADGGINDHAITYDLLSRARIEFNTNGVISEDVVRLVCDDLYQQLSYGGITTSIRNGNIDLLSSKRIENNEFSSGTIVCGDPDILIAKRAKAKSFANMTMADAKVMVADYVSTLHWSEDEERMIPQFSDDVEVPEHVITMAQRFIQSLDWETPMVNPGWRGTTGLGKSYGVKMLACILHTPLLWMTCSSTTELEDFLSKHVPNTDSDTESCVASKDLPTFEDISYDPAYAYKMLTGIDKDDATSEDALEAYGNAVAASKAESRNPFKIVNSDFVTALINGYIVEVQEFSRIRDSGTLVGLNNFCEPDAVIPLVDGRHVRRNKRAMVVWTDNYGYSSCRKVDGSVLSRISYIFSDYSLDRDLILRRMVKNTGASKKLIDKMIDVWQAIQNFCKEHDITDEGTCSMRELQNWIQLTVLDGEDYVANTCMEAIISKLSSDPDTQDEIMNGCVVLELAKAKLTE